MPDPASLALYFGAALVLALTPGPGIFYVAARTLSGGRAEGIASSLGTGLGGLVHVLAGAIGISAVIMASAQGFTALKLVGAAYLLWLGFRTFKDARAPLQILEAQATMQGSPKLPPPGSTHRAFREGVLVEALNPKTAAFFLAFIPQFVDPLAGNIGVQFAFLGTISVALNTLVDLAVALAASRIRRRVTTQPNLIERLRQGSGLTLMALGVGLALVKRPA